MTGRRALGRTKMRLYVFETGFQTNLQRKKETEKTGRNSGELMT
jgi:hypothetical protein